MTTYRGYQIRPGGFLGAVDILLGHGEVIDQVGSVEEARKIIDRWLDAR